MATFSTTLVFLIMGFASNSMGEELRIERDSNLKLSQDDIRVPDSECPSSIPNCDIVKGNQLGGCWCSCGTIQNENSSFYEPSFTCVRVSQVRQQAECQLLFQDEIANDHLTFLPTDTVREKDVAVPTNRRCTFFYGNQSFVQYLDCTGSWISVTQQDVLDTIELTPGWSTSYLKIRFKVGTTLFQSTVAGRLIRVAIQCRQDTPSAQLPSSCVVFQVHGQVTCQYPQVTLSPGSSQATLPPPATEGLNNSGTLPPVTTPVKKPTTKPPSEPPTTKETAQPPATQSPQPTTGGGTNPPNEGTTPDEPQAGSRKESQKNTFIIAGSVAGGILLIALILLILWRCNSPKKRSPNSHHRLEGSISRPVSHMSRNSIPVYTDASYMTPMGGFNERTRSMDNPTYRRTSEGIILGPDYKRGSIYSDSYPTSVPPRPPPGAAKRASLNGQVNPALSLKEEYVTMNPLYEGQVVDHKDLEELNCRDFGVSPDQVVLDTRKDPEEFNETYDCPGDILNSQRRASPIPVYYVLDEPYPDSITNTFNRATTGRGRPDGHVYDEPEADLSRGRPYVVMDHPRGIIYTHEYDEPPRDEQPLSIHRLTSPPHGILKGGSGSPNNARYQSGQDEHVEII